MAINKLGGLRAYLETLNVEKIVLCKTLHKSSVSPHVKTGIGKSCLLTLFKAGITIEISLLFLS